MKRTRQLLEEWQFPHIVVGGVNLVSRENAEMCLLFILEHNFQLHGYDDFTLFDDNSIQPHMEWSASWSWKRLPDLDEMLLQLREPPVTVTHIEFVFSDGL